MCWCLPPPPTFTAQSVDLRVAGSLERRAWLSVPGARVTAAGALLLHHELEECCKRAPRRREVIAFSSLTFTLHAHTLVP